MPLTNEILMTYTWVSLKNYIKNKNVTLTFKVKVVEQIKQNHNVLKKLSPGIHKIRYQGHSMNALKSCINPTIGCMESIK